MEILLLQYVYDGKNTNTAITLFYTIFICHDERKITQKSWTKKQFCTFLRFVCKISDSLKKRRIHERKFVGEDKKAMHFSCLPKHSRAKQGTKGVCRDGDFLHFLR